MQAAGYASEDGTITRAMIMEKVEDAVKQHNKKMTWLSDEENRENRCTFTVYYIFVSTIDQYLMDIVYLDLMPDFYVF